jgi:hypothetical protein
METITVRSALSFAGEPGPSVSDDLPSPVAHLAADVLRSLDRPRPRRWPLLVLGVLLLLTGLAALVWRLWSAAEHQG